MKGFNLACCKHTQELSCTNPLGRRRKLEWTKEKLQKKKKVCSIWVNTFMCFTCSKSNVEKLACSETMHARDHKACMEAVGKHVLPPPTHLHACARERVF